MNPLRKYLFGYLFVRLAKIISVIVVLAGLASAVVAYVQANLAADSARYQRSQTMQQSLNKLGSTFTRTRELVSALAGPDSVAKIGNDRREFGAASDAEFDRLTAELDRVEQDARGLKQAVVSRFELLVGQIEEKLRAHAASVTAIPAPSGSPAAVNTPSPSISRVAIQSTHEIETLFSDNLSSSDVVSRSYTMESSKQLIRVLKGSAENSAYRAILAELAEQLDALKSLLPSRAAPTPPPMLSPSPVSSNATVGAPIPLPKVVVAEKVARQLREVRASVRDAILSSWALDTAIEEATRIAGLERTKCRSQWHLACICCSKRIFACCEGRRRFSCIGLLRPNTEFPRYSYERGGFGRSP